VLERVRLKVRLDEGVNRDGVSTLFVNVPVCVPVPDFLSSAGAAVQYFRLFNIY
jgi:hypothetical protein